MKKRVFLSFLLLFLFLAPVLSLSLYSPLLESDIMTPAYMKTDQYLAEDGFGLGYGSFSETGDYVDTWFNDASVYYVSDSLTIYLVLVFQLPDIGSLDYDNIVFHADWRYTASFSDTGYWALGYPNGTIVAAHNTLYSYTGTDSGYEEKNIELAIDADVIQAQNSTGYISFILLGGGINTYGIYCDFAYIGFSYTHNFASQTVQGDTYLYPDPQPFTAVYGYGEGIGGFTETNDYTDTQTNDGTYWYCSDSLIIYEKMFMQLPDLSKFDMIVFHADWRYTSSYSDTGYWSLGDSTGTIIAAHNNLYSYTGTDSGYEEKDIELAIDADVIQAQNSTGYISFILSGGGINTYGIYCDYAYVSVYRNYTESFADVSDVVYESSQTAEYGMGTNGDCMEIWSVLEDTGGEATQYEVDVNFDLSADTYYVEYGGYCENVSAANLQVYFLYTDTSTEWFPQVANENYGVTNEYISSNEKTIDKIRFVLNDVDLAYNGNWSVYFDYLRIGPANEMGWSHDCSTLAGTDIPEQDGWTIDAESDGAQIDVNYSRNGGTDNYGEFFFFYDTTSTSIGIDTDYYPFIFVNFTIHAIGTDSRMTVVPRTGGYRYTTWTFDEAGNYEAYLNFGAVTLGGSGEYIDIHCTNTTDYTGDSWANISIYSAMYYGIANYTLTQSSTTVNDYLYVSKGILYSDMSSGSIILDLDPMQYNLTGSQTWNKTISQGTNELSCYHGYSWTAYDDSTTGELIGTNITDVRIRFTGDSNIYGLTFTTLPQSWHIVNIGITIVFDLPEWNIVNSPIVQFIVLIPFAYLDSWLMFLGMIMIPASTLFLAYGGKKKMSRDKLFFFLILFIVGWGLFLGGIM